MKNYLSNKKIGSDFEQRVCDVLAADGYWVHFIVPDSRGAQPFDIIAVKGGIAYAIDCKTCVAKSISINRLEENQIAAFELWLRRGNTMPVVAVEHDGDVRWIDYGDLKERGTVKICTLRSTIL